MVEVHDAVQFGRQYEGVVSPYILVNRSGRGRSNWLG
jgi:hypothetical protein